MRFIQTHKQEAMVIGGVLTAAGLIFSQAWLLVLASLVAGLPIAVNAWEALRYKQISIELLVTIALVGAVMIGEPNHLSSITSGQRTQKCAQRIGRRQTEHASYSSISHLTARKGYSLVEQRQSIAHRTAGAFSDEPQSRTFVFDAFLSENKFQMLDNARWRHVAQRAPNQRNK